MILKVLLTNPFSANLSSLTKNNFRLNTEMARNIRNTRFFVGFKSYFQLRFYCLVRETPMKVNGLCIIYIFKRGLKLFTWFLCNEPYYNFTPFFITDHHFLYSYIFIMAFRFQFFSGAFSSNFKISKMD